MPETAIGPEGRTVRCAKCKHSWFQDGAEIAPQPGSEPPAAAPPAAAPSASPPPSNTPQRETPKPAETASKPANTPPPAQTAAPSVDHWRSNPPTEAATKAASEAAPETPAAPATEPEDASDPLEESRNASDPLAGAQDDDPYYDQSPAAFDDEDYDEAGSSFDYRPPFTRRRNSAKMWTIAAAAFATLATGTVLAVNYYGLPDWVPIQRPTFGIGKSDLELDFPASEQRKEALASGEEIFQVRGVIRNVGQESTSVPSLLVVFRDAREKNVYSWVIVPSKRELAPGESLNVTEAITDIPPAAQAAEIGWSPN